MFLYRVRTLLRGVLIQKGGLVSRLVQRIRAAQLQNSQARERFQALGARACDLFANMQVEHFAACNGYECDLPGWPQWVLLYCSEPPRGMVRVFQLGPA
jgi:hypothetical protein